MKRRAFVAFAWVMGVSTTLAQPTARSTSAWFPSTTPARLAAAHRAFLREDYPAMLTALEDQLRAAPSDERLLGNASLLVDKAFELRGQAGLPLPWRLAPEIRTLEVVERRTEAAEGTTFRVEVRGDASDVGLVAGLSLERGANDVVLDKEAGVGVWAEFGPSRSDHARQFFLRAPESPKPLPAGVYTLHLRLKSGAEMRGSVLLTGMVASAAPEVVVPAQGKEIPSHTFTSQWRDFRSPESRPFEDRTVDLTVQRLGFERDKVGDRWGRYYVLLPVRPDFEALALGSPDHGAYGEPELVDGHYDLELTFAESRRLGDLHLVRESARRVSFFVLGR